MANVKNRKQSEVFFRRVLELGIGTDTELSQIVGTTPSAISDARRRKKIPKRWISIISGLYDISPERLLGIEAPPDQIFGQRDKKGITQIFKDIQILKNKVVRLEQEVSFLKNPKVSKRANKIGRGIT